MGSVSLQEDISDRSNDDATNVVVTRIALTSIKSLPNGTGIRPPRIRAEILVLQQNFERAIVALQTCNQRPLPTNPKKRSRALIDQAVEGSWLREEMHQAWKALIEGLPPQHEARAVLENGLRQVS
jgi:hypothetical protein